MSRKARGEHLRPSVEASAVVLSYRGLDDIERRTRFEFSPAADISASGAIFELSLEPREVARLYITARCELVGTAAPHRLKYDEARAQAWTRSGMAKLTRAPYMHRTASSMLG